MSPFGSPWEAGVSKRDRGPQTPTAPGSPVSGFGNSWSRHPGGDPSHPRSRRRAKLTTEFGAAPCERPASLRGGSLWGSPGVLLWGGPRRGASPPRGDSHFSRCLWGGGVSQHHGGFASGSFRPWNTFSFLALSKTLCDFMPTSQWEGQVLAFRWPALPPPGPQGRVRPELPVACRAPESLAKLFLGWFLLPERILGGQK